MNFLFCGVRRLAVRWIVLLKWVFFTTKKDGSTGPTALESDGPYFEMMGQWPRPTIKLKACTYFHPSVNIFRFLLNNVHSFVWFWSNFISHLNHYSTFNNAPDHWLTILCGTSLIISSSDWIVKSQYEPQHKISNNMVCATSKGSDQPAHMRSLIRAFASHLNILWLLSYWRNSIWSF